MIDTIIVGGGAAGYFAAAKVLDERKGHNLIILEQSDKVLQKVKVSGGGRCNVTNAVFQREHMNLYYPRGWKLMRKILSRFSHEDCIQWFELNGVPLYAQDDNRMFPESNRSQSVIDCLESRITGKQAQVILSSKVVDLSRKGEGWVVHTNKGKTYEAKQVLFATGGSKFIYHLLSRNDIAITEPVPSLFTFNIDDGLIDGLEGISVPNALVRVNGTKLTSDGPLLITHWGLSGPAVLKLSSWAARDLAERGYRFTVSVNWTGLPIAKARQHLEAFRQSSGKKKVSNSIPFEIPKRLYYRFLESSGISMDRVWPELGKKAWNTLMERITNSNFHVEGKSTFKEEFVTCGGVDLKEIDPKTMEHRKLKGLYFAGEVLNIDAITGGYNFQAAWTTAAVAAAAIVEGDD